MRRPQPQGQLGTVVWALAVALTTLVVAPSAGLAQLPRIGLYKDGQLVEEFDAPVGASEANDLALAPVGGAKAKDRLRQKQKRSRARGPLISPQTAARNASLRQASKPGARIREALGEMKSGRTSDKASRRAELRSLLEELRGAHAEAHRAMQDTEIGLRELKLPKEILDRHAGSVAAMDEAFQRLATAADRVAEGDDSAVDQALAAASSLAPAHQPEFADLGPTIQQHVEQAPQLTRAEADALLAPSASKTRSISGGSATTSLGPPTPADLAPTLEVQLTPEVIAKAAALGNSPLAIYEFVRNEVGFEPYVGSRKGAAETLRQMNGNDTDQASLLLALLRAAGVPCRYVRGTVEMTAERTKNWLGVDDGATAGSILATAGLEGVSIMNGAEVEAVRCTRVWVEAYLPYSNYRGIPNDQRGKAWIPLDPAFNQSTITPGQDILGQMNYNSDAFLAEYVSTFHVLSPIEKLVADIQAYLDFTQPGTGIEQIERSFAIRPQQLGLLPASLPYKVLATSARLAELEDDKRYKVRFRLYDGGTSLIDYTTNLSQIAGHRVVIDYVGATPADQAVIDGFGGIFETPPNLVNLKPRLKVDSVPVAVSTNSVGMGRSHSSDVHFIQPAGSSNVKPVIQNSITAGNTQAIGFNTFLDDNAGMFEEPLPGIPLLESVLHSNAAAYLGSVDAGIEQVNRLMRVVTTQDVSEAILESSVAVTTSFGVPVTFEATGLIVDADRRIVGPFQVEGDDTMNLPFMLLSGYDGSVMENRLFEDTYGQPAVSTIKILELASDSGIPIYRITTSIANDAPGLNQPPAVVNAINNALAQGHHVIIPRDGITVSDWSGTGYIDLNPTTGAAGYIISGGISGSTSAHGGATVVPRWSRSLNCDATNVTCEIKKPAADSPAAGAVHCEDETGKLAFELLLKVTCKDEPEQEIKWDIETTLSIKAIAAAHGVGHYTLTLYALGSTPCQRKVSIVKIESETVSSKPADKKRTKIGVGEEVNLKMVPEIAGSTWKTGSGKVDPASGATTTYTADDTEGSNEITLTFPGGTCKKKFTMVAPSGVDNATIAGTSNYPVGDAGAAMHLYPVVVGPTDVSFYRVMMLEVGEDGSNITGYFTRYTTAQYSHKAFGADVWFQLDEANQWPSSWDHASSGAGAYIPPPYSPGSLTWNIPAKWKVNGTTTEHLITGWNQVFTIDAAGTVTVAKFGHSVSRTTADVITTH